LQIDRLLVFLVLVVSEHQALVQGLTNQGLVHCWPVCLYGGIESSGNDTGSSLRFQSSTFRRIIFTFDNKYFHISTISQRFSPKTIDRVPEVQGLLFAPCTVGPYGLPRRPPIYSQRSAPCLLFVMVHKTLQLHSTRESKSGATGLRIALVDK
jgi:hypothetical protein